MLKRTYDKIYLMFEDAGGYLSTGEMLDNGISTVHIRELLEKNRIEKVSHGNYWGTFLGMEKPENYPMIEACMTNKKAVICGPSACYYHGLLSDEPKKLYVATARSDRSAMKLSFPVSRHYFSVKGFDEELETFEYHGTTVRVTGLDRSVCDTIRIQEPQSSRMISEIIKAYRADERSNPEKLREYAEKMRVGRVIQSKLGKENR